MLDTMFNATDTNINGINIFVITLAARVIENNIMGSSVAADVIPPLVTNNVNNIGNRQFTKPTKFSIEVLIKLIMSAKFFIMIVTIIIYDT